jgi:YD repeat-containing protein
LTVVLRHAPVAESDEGKPGAIDYDAQGNLASIEVLNSSTSVEDPASVTHRMSAAATRIIQKHRASGASRRDART